MVNFGIYNQRLRPVDEYLVKLFGLARELPPNVNRPDVVKALETLLADVPPDKHVCFKNTKSEKIFMFYNSGGTQFFFVKNVFTVFLKSIIYPDRVKAVETYTRNRITWVERKHIPTPESVPTTPVAPTGSG